MIISERTKKRKIINELNIVYKIMPIQSQSSHKTYTVNHQHILENSATYINSLPETPTIIHTENQSLTSTLSQNIPNESSEPNLNHETGKNYLTNQLSEMTSECKPIKKCIADWKVEFNISHHAVNSLLKGLKEHKCLNDFPIDSRTLMNTPK